MRYLVVVPADSIAIPGMTILPAPMGAITVMGDGACIEEASMVVRDYPGAKIWDSHRRTVVPDRPATALRRRARSRQPAASQRSKCASMLALGRCPIISPSMRRR